MVRQRFSYYSPSQTSSEIQDASRITALLFPRFAEIYHLKAYKLMVDAQLSATDFNNIGNTLTWRMWLLANNNMESIGASGLYTTNQIDGHHRHVIDSYNRHPLVTGENTTQEHILDGVFDSGWVYTDLPVIGLWFAPFIDTPDAGGHRFSAIIEYEAERVELEYWISIAALYGFDVDQLQAQHGRAGQAYG